MSDYMAQRVRELHQELLDAKEREGYLQGRLDAAKEELARLRPVAQATEDLSPKEAAGVLGIDYTTCIRRLQSGEIKGWKAGRFWRVPREEIERIRSGG